jgi:hypothetical protein
MRRSFISMTWTPDVPADDARLLIRRIEDIYNLLRPHLGKEGQFDPLPAVRVFGAWELSDAPEASAYRGIDWILHHASGSDDPRISAARYQHLIEMEPWQATQPHFDLCLTDLPLDEDRPGCSPGQDVIGFSRRGLVSLMSTYPFRLIRMDALRTLGLQHLYAHYLGLMFDAPRPDRTGDIEQVDGDVYCTNLCAMRHTPTPARAIAFGQEQAGTGAIYCPACQQNIVACITSYHYGVN